MWLHLSAAEGRGGLPLSGAFSPLAEPPSIEMKKARRVRAGFSVFMAWVSGKAYSAMSLA